jgi:hypothetical protein
MNLSRVKGQLTPLPWSESAQKHFAAFPSYIGIVEMWRTTMTNSKTKWGWCGFTTQDRQRCAVMARMIALIYNW